MNLSKFAQPGGPPSMGLFYLSTNKYPESPGVREALGPCCAARQLSGFSFWRIAMSEIPKGLCQCGCGGETKLARQSDKNKGWIKGQPLKFIAGHYHFGKGPLSVLWKGGRTDNHGYVMVFAPDHPRATKIGYVGEPYLIVEKILGKLLPLSAVIHHVNHDKSDNSPENFVVCQDQTYHNLLHSREKALKECGYVNWRKCSFCKQYDDPLNLVNGGNRNMCHKSCKTQYDKERYQLKKNKNLEDIRHG